MSPLLDELWVFSRAGVPIVDFSREKNVDKTFLGFFISAIITLTGTNALRSIVFSVVLPTWQ